MTATEDTHTTPEGEVTTKKNHKIPVVPYVYVLPPSMKAFEDLLNFLFKLDRRGVTIKSECVAGCVQFLSCLYVLPVIPGQLSKAGYPIDAAAVICCACCAIGSIAGGLFSNLPMIVAPPTSVSIFLVAYLRGNSMTFHQGNQAVIVSGCILIALGFRPLSRFFSRMIPSCIQLATGIGIGMLTALAGCIEINLVQQGKYTLVELGPITDEVAIAMAGLMIVGILLYYHVKGAFCACLLFGSIVYWSDTNTFPDTIASSPTATAFSELVGNTLDMNTILLFLDLSFLYIVTISGLARAFADLAHITNENGTVPRGRWLYVICGLLTIFSGCYGGPPILISPESGAGIKAGGRTGLSSVVGGIIFGFAAFFTPLFQAVPPAATAPLLIAVGVVLFANTKKIDWTNYSHAFPAYIVLFLIPFTYSILKGVFYGWGAYLVMNFFTGDLFLTTRSLMNIYCPALSEQLFNDKEISKDEGKTEKGLETTHDTHQKPAPRRTSQIATAVAMTSIFNEQQGDEADDNEIGMFGDLEVADKPLPIDFFKALQIAKFGPQDDHEKSNTVEIQMQDMETPNPLNSTTTTTTAHSNA